MSLSDTLRFILSHPMNRGRPVSTLGRFIKWQAQSRIRGEVIFHWIDGSKLAVRRGMTGATGNIYCELHEYVDMSFVLHTLKPGDLFVDIGANVGSYTVLASRVCGAKVVAVEPDPHTAGYLRRNVEINGMENVVQVVEAALGSSEGFLSFTIGLDTVNKVAKAEDRNVREVPVKTLDEVLNGQVPKVIKIDVEGYEAEVLKGAINILQAPSLKAIIIETLDDEVGAILREAGFRRSYYDPETRMLSSLPCSFVSHNSLMLRCGPKGIE